MAQHELEVLVFQHFMDIHPILGWVCVIGLIGAFFAVFMFILINAVRSD